MAPSPSTPRRARHGHDARRQRVDRIAKRAVRRGGPVPPGGFDATVAGHEAHRRGFEAAAQLFRELTASKRVARRAVHDNVNRTRHSEPVYTRDPIEEPGDADRRSDRGGDEDVGRPNGGPTLAVALAGVRGEILETRARVDDDEAGTLREPIGHRLAVLRPDLRPGGDVGQPAQRAEPYAGNGDRKLVEIAEIVFDGGDRGPQAP